MQRPSRPLSLPSALLFLGLGISLIVTQSGCPGGAELDNPEAWGDRLPNNTGGLPNNTGGLPNNTGGAPAATGGTTATGGSAMGGSGGMQTNWVLDLNTVTCPGGLNAATVVTTDCAKTGCHKGSLSSAGLDLTPANIANKTKDKPATHLNIQCSAPTEPYVECIPATCPAPGSTLLVDSKNPDQSWMLKKLHDTSMTCGDVMPFEAEYTADQADRSGCIEAVVRAIAGLQ